MAEPKQLKAIKGGLNITKRLLADKEQEAEAIATITAAQRAEAGRKGAALIKSQPPVKASEALGQQMEKGVKRVTTTQADRTRVGGGNIGGAPFSAISEADPNYAGKVWGVMDEGTAARLKNLTDPETVWTTMLGSANQLKTNPVVFDKLKRQFLESMKQGNLSPELEAKINHNLALNFGEGANIRDPKIWRQADTFEKRAALADLMMGQGIPPSKGGVALGGEKSGKGVIFKPTDTLKRETEPSLLHTEHGGDVPTFAAGPRLFKLEKESVYRPDLHPGFPTLLTGKDMNVNMIPTPTEIFLPDWHKAFKEKKPERFQRPWSPEIVQRRKSGSYEVKGEGPGYYDLALGLEGEGLPSQALHDEYIRHLIREGFKKGGKVDIKASDARLSQAIAKRMSGGGMAKGGGVDIKASDARLEAAINARMGMAKGGEVGFKKIQFMNKGGKLVEGVTTIGKRLLQDAPVAPKVKPPSDNVANVRQANFRYPKTVGNQTVGIDKLSGGVRMSDPNEVKRVKALADQIASPEGYISRIIVDHNDNVIEGQHRLEALRQLGIKDVPVYKIEEMADTMPVDQMKSAVQGVGAIHPDHVGQIINHALESIASEGVEGARQMDLGRFQKHYDAALNAITPDIKKAHGGIAHMDKGGKAGKLASGIANVSKRLMADNSLPALERDANLQKFLAESKTPMRLYHGTTATEGGKGQEAIRRLKPSKEGALGSGVYMTPNTAHASGYTGIPNDEAIESMLVNPLYQSTGLKALNQRNSGNLLPAQKGGNMLPVHAQIRNPLIIGKSGRNIDPAADALMSLGMDEASAVRLVERAFEEKGNIGKQIQTRAQAQGYDGIMQYRGDDLSEVVSYRPNAVKSAIGNRGTYDINEPDLSKARGGLAMAGGGSIQENLKNIQNYSVLDKGATRKPNELGGVVLAGASWMAGDEKTKLAKQLFGEEVTNTAIGGQKTSDVLKQLNEFKGNGGTFAPNTTVVLDIGANDIATGVDESVIRNNLNEIVSRLGEEGVHVILSGQPEAHSYDEAIKSTTLQMDDLYSDIAANNPNVTLVDAMSGMLNDKSLMDESGFHLNSDEAKLAYLNQFANAYKGMDTANQGFVDTPQQVAQTSYPVDIPQEVAQITQVDKPAERYTPEAQVDFMPAVIESEPSAGYIYAQNNSGVDNYYNVINDYLAQERTQDEIQAAMEQYGVSQADVDAARDYQPSGGRFDESYATEAYADGGSAFKTIQWQKPQKFDGGGIASPEETNPFAGSRREPLLTEKDWANIKRNAPEVYEWAKQNVKDEASQLKSARGVKDFALRTGAQYLGGIPDLANLGLMGVDALANTNLSSEKPWFGSEQSIDAMRKAGMIGEHEFPISETIAGILAPAGLIKKGVKKMGNMRPAKEAPKKRRGGLTAMSR
jgi:acyl-CoA thioesterase-1